MFDIIEYKSGTTYYLLESWEAYTTQKQYMSSACPNVTILGSGFDNSLQKYWIWWELKGNRSGARKEQDNDV